MKKKKFQIVVAILLQVVSGGLSAAQVEYAGRVYGSYKSIYPDALTKSYLAVYHVYSDGAIDANKSIESAFNSAKNEVTSFCREREYPKSIKTVFAMIDQLDVTTTSAFIGHGRVGNNVIQGTTVVTYNLICFVL